MHKIRITVFREAFKKKPKKSLEFSKPGGRGSRPIPNFFFDYFGFFLKALGKHWKWSDSSRNAKKKISLLWGGGTLYCMVPYCTKLYSTLSKFGLQIFFLPFLDELGHIHLFLCVFGRLEKTQNFGNFPNFRGGRGVGFRKVWKIPNFFGFFFWRLPLLVN